MINVFHQRSVGYFGVQVKIHVVLAISKDLIYTIFAISKYLDDDQEKQQIVLHLTSQCLCKISISFYADLCDTFN